MIYAMDRATPIPCRGIAGEGRDRKSVDQNTSREQRKRRPEVYVTEAQMAKGRGPKRGEATQG